MKKSYLIVVLILTVNLCLGQESYKEISPADFDLATRPQIGQYTNISFKYLPLNNSTGGALEYDYGNNFSWFIVAERKGKVFLTEDLLQNGFVLAINKKLENIYFIKASMHVLINGKVVSTKLKKKLIKREQEDDSIHYHFYFDGYTPHAICEISYSTKTKFNGENLLTIRMNEISTIHEARVDFVVPEYLGFTVNLIGIDNKLTHEETVYESTDARGNRSDQIKRYQCKKTSYYTDANSLNVRPLLIATPIYLRKPFEPLRLTK